MNLSRQLILVPVVALFATVSAPAVAETIYSAGNLDFETQDQSMWGSGDAFIFDRTGDNAIFAGASWDTGATLDAIFGGVDTITIVPSVCDPIGWFGGGCTDPVTATVDTRTGFVADVQTNGRLGFEVGLSIDSGSVDALVSYDAQLSIPDPRDIGLGEFINLNPQSGFADPNSIATTFPTIAGSLSLVAEAHAEFGVRGCAIGFGCTGRASESFDVGGTYELISFNEDGEGGIEYFDGDPIMNTLLDIGAQAAGVELPDGFPASVPIILGRDPATQTPREIGEVVLHLPQPNTTGGLSGDSIRSTAADDFLDFVIDVDNLVSLAATAAASSGAVATTDLFEPSATLEIGDDLSASAAFTILDFDIIPNLDLRQSFELTPTLMVDLEFSTPVMIAGMAGSQTAYSGRWDTLPSIAFLARETIVTPTFWVSAGLNNQLALDANIQATLDLLTVEFSLEAFGFNIPIGGPIGVGNVFDDEANLFTTPPLFNQTFALRGFNSIQGDSFAVRVPEPGTLLLLGSGLLLLGAGQGRRRKKT